MLLTLRDKNQKMAVKDYLDIDFDMKVEQYGDKYRVRVNRSFYLDEIFDSEAEAEQAITAVAQCRNSLEQELRNY